MVADSPTPPTPENNLLLRQMQGIRRDLLENHEREARMIDLVNRLVARVDEGFGRVRDEMSRTRDDVGAVQRDLNAIRSDLILMENRILTAITEVRRLAERFDSAAEELD